MLKHFRTYLLAAILLLLLHPFFRLYAQCNPAVGQFPYRENFENNNGNWQAGGNLPSWEWGVPAKPVISSASSGIRCWVTGGLSGTAYNSGEASWLQSPCFDFSTLAHPYLRFDLWWETERQFDGAALQYSTDNGLSWQNTVSDAVNCLDSNFYDNNTSVTYLAALGAGAGWSGNVQSGSGSCLSGGGSGRWVTVAKTLQPLAGKTQVLLRIAFGAGTQCNDFDGIGVDNIRIEEAPANNGVIEYSCLNRTVAFRYSGRYCPQSYRWNFGDPSSGADDSSALSEPVHTFSGGGNYRVSVTVSGPENGAFTATSDVQVLETAVTQLSRPGCSNEPTGRAVLSVSGANGPFDISWNTVPGQSGDTAINLSAGTYRVEVSANGGCPAEDSISFSFSKPALSATVVQPACGNDGASIQLNVTGGTAPYRYAWDPPVSNDSGATELSSGNYRIWVTDAEGCGADSLITIPAGPPCTGIFFPSAFTPDKPGANNRFGPAGSLSLIRDFSLQVFNRFGQQVFFSNNPQIRWDGTFRQVNQPVGAYVWFTTFRIGDNPPRTRSGTVVLLH